MYFVDREKIEEQLFFIEKNIVIIENQSNWKTSIEALALERAAHLLIEAILDVGNGMIDGFIMRDPGSYEDIVDILVDENVIPHEFEDAIKQVISLRKVLVQNYLEIDHRYIESTIMEYIKDIKQFPNWVRRYLNEELGPVSAFRH
ncbi:DUF86 domain-containing protein [Bacillus carboniphilus]|uniref:DUF86 domain-containing protein n=1 Tax=Bacillus carboniphilus TaxID=86663 RepID=A0ABY9JRE7_9BACI|nr:DUF86 domain-containing protein [Bacillus carboniphilus]WLR41303.1 DUF86 domain-containing protein [Bacillus carboniphilus]